MREKKATPFFFVQETELLLFQQASKYFNWVYVQTKKTFLFQKKWVMENIYLNIFFRNFSLPDSVKKKTKNQWLWNNNWPNFCGEKKKFWLFILLVLQTFGKVIWLPIFNFNFLKNNSYRRYNFEIILVFLRKKTAEWLSFFFCEKRRIQLLLKNKQRTNWQNWIF